MYGATQTSGGTFNNTSYKADYLLSFGGVFGRGGSVSMVGTPPNGSPVGGAGGLHAGGSGGSSYISGYAGVNSVQATGGTDTQPLATNQTLHYSGKYFVDATMIAGSNAMPSYDGKTTMIGNSGHARGKISFVSTLKPKRNSNLNQVRYITDCTNGNTINDWNHWVELQAIENGVNVAKNKTIQGTGTLMDGGRILDGIVDSQSYGQQMSGLQCITVDLGTVYNLDEIATWYYYVDGRSYHNHTLKVSSDNVNWKTLMNNISGTKETSNGRRTQAYH